MISSASTHPVERATYTLAEAAVLLGIGRTTAYEAARAGTFPARVVRVGRRWLVVRASLDVLLSESAG